MTVINKLKRALRGEVNLTTAAREAFRRSYAAAQSRRERAAVGHEGGLELKREFSKINPEELLTHFRNDDRTGAADLLRHFQTRKPICLSLNPALNPLVPDSQLVDCNAWRRDPRSGYEWPLDYHRDIKLMRS